MMTYYIVVIISVAAVVLGLYLRRKREHPLLTRARKVRSRSGAKVWGGETGVLTPDEWEKLNGGIGRGKAAAFQRANAKGYAYWPTSFIALLDPDGAVRDVPAFSLPDGGTIGGINFPDENLIAIPDYTKVAYPDWSQLEAAVEHEFWHLILYENDRAEWERTREE